MPIIRDVDNNDKDSKKQDTDKIMDEAKFEMRVNKPPTYGPQSQTTLEAFDIPSGMPLSLATIIL